MKIKIYNESLNPLPSYKTSGAAGMDVRITLPEGKKTITLNPRDRITVGTGITVAIPEGYEIQVRPRSGLAVDYGITVLNSPGTIDSDFRGEIKVILINHGIEPFDILQGERVAQLVLHKVERIEWEEVSTTASLSITDRGAGGFGHTGKS